MEDTDKLKELYAEYYHATQEMLKRVALHADQGSFEVAEAWLGNAGVFFGKTAEAFFSLYKVTKSAKLKGKLMEEMFELQGDLEGATGVIQEWLKMIQIQA